MNKKTLYILIIVLIILIILFLLFRDKLFPARCADGSFAVKGSCGDKEEKDKNDKAQTQGQDPNPTSTTGSVGCSIPTAYTTLLETANPPYAVGDKGFQIEKVQRGLGIKADGYFGCQTQAALIKQFNSPIITQQIYNKFA